MVHYGKKKIIYEYPPICYEPFHALGDNIYKYYNDSEALHHRVMVMSGPNVINLKCQLEVLDEAFHYKEFVFSDLYFVYPYFEKNSQKRNTFNEIAFISDIDVIDLQPRINFQNRTFISKLIVSQDHIDKGLQFESDNNFCRKVSPCKYYLTPFSHYSNEVCSFSLRALNHLQFDFHGPISK